MVEVLGFEVAWQLVMAAAVLVLLVPASVLADRVGGFSVPFVLSFVAVIVAVGDALVPRSVVGSLLPGFIPALNPVMVLIWAGLVILALWVFEARVNDGADSPEEITRQVGNEAEGLARSYSRMARYGLASVLAIATIALGQAGQVLGDLADLAFAQPLITANAATLLGGYAILYREVVPGVSVFEFGIVAAAITVVALAVRYQ